jgi:glucose-6-phosphate 1-dehydrogenase
MRGEEVELVLRSHPADQLIAPYERLLEDAMRGDPELFARQDTIEAAWRVLDPVLHDAAEPQNYEPGSWGPPSAERLATEIGGWLAPSPLCSTPAAHEPTPGAEPPRTDSVQAEPRTEPVHV